MDWNTSSKSSAYSGKLLAHEFIKLRFGIFDEIGFADDLLYPSQFKMNGQWTMWRVTGFTSIDLLRQILRAGHFSHKERISMLPALSGFFLLQA